MLFFIDKIPPQNSEFRFTDEEQRHLYSLRPNIGDTVTLSDGKEFFAQSEIAGADKKGFILRVGEAVPIPQNKNKTTLLLPLLKSDKNETVIQKATELGIDEIVLFVSENCVVGADKSEKKSQRYEKIALAASMQCKRLFLPSIKGVVGFDEALDILAKENGFICYEKAEKLLSKHLGETTLQNMAFMTGPEGGFSSAEAQKAIEHNVPLISLGDRILRAETAPICVLAVFRAFKSEM